MYGEVYIFSAGDGGSWKLSVLWEKRKKIELLITAKNIIASLCRELAIVYFNLLSLYMYLNQIQSNPRLSVTIPQK